MSAPDLNSDADADLATLIAPETVEGFLRTILRYEREAPDLGRCGAYQRAADDLVRTYPSKAGLSWEQLLNAATTIAMNHRQHRVHRDQDTTVRAGRGKR
jgi:hypothetical protein